MISPSDLQNLVTESLIKFYQQRMQRLESLQLKDVLRKKNPYLFKALGIENAAEIIEGLLGAFLTSSDETIFGNVFFEPIALAVSGGVVASSEGVDIVVESETRYTAIAVKSGPNPFNSSQVKRQDQEFRTLRSRLMKIQKQFDPLLGHCYGRRRGEPTDKRIYRIRAGQAFWAELTGDDGFYLKLMDAISRTITQEHRDRYTSAWNRAVNRYTFEFARDFCTPNGAIDWKKLLAYNSGATRPKGRRATR